MPTPVRKLKERKRNLKSSLKHAMAPFECGKFLLPGLGFGLLIMLSVRGCLWKSASLPISLLQAGGLGGGLPGSPQSA